jgi:hypothetical protein
VRSDQEIAFSPPPHALSWYENRPDTFSGKSPHVRLQERHYKHPGKDAGENNNSFLKGTLSTSVGLRMEGHSASPDSLKADSHIPCRSAKSLDYVFPI